MIIDHPTTPTETQDNRTAYSFFHNFLTEYCMTLIENYNNNNNKYKYYANLLLL